MIEKNPSLSQIPFIPTALAVKPDEVLEIAVAAELAAKDPDDEVAENVIAQASN